SQLPEPSGTSSSHVVPGSSSTGAPSVPVSTRGASTASLDHVTGTCRPPLATTPSPVPTSSVSGTGTPAGSLNRVFCRGAARSTTLVAASRTSSDDTAGASPSLRTQRPSPPSHSHTARLANVS